MEFQCLKYVKKEAISYITLDRPDKLNALNPTMMAEIREVLDVIELDPDVRVAILTGAGRAFSAGFDLEREAGDSDPHDMGADEWRDHLKTYIDTFMMIWNLSKPVIAAVNGMACGGAFYLLGECDILIAAEHATFFDPHVTYGMPAIYEPMKMLGKMPFGEAVELLAKRAAERCEARGVGVRPRLPAGVERAACEEPRGDHRQPLDALLALAVIHLEVVGVVSHAADLGLGPLGQCEHLVGLFFFFVQLVYCF